MDTLAANPVTPITPTPNSHKNFRLVFFLLLLAVLAAATATTYILVGSKNTQELPDNSVSESNPFDSLSSYSNPFASDTQSSVNNPFEDTGSTNPFDQFVSQAQPAQTNDTYQNPF